jgi:hypothetical protein
MEPADVLKLQKSSSRQETAADKEGFLGRILPFIFASDKAERTKRRQLKEIARQVRRVRPRLYNPRKEVVEPELGRLFYSFYRTLHAARELLRSASTSMVLKSVIVEMSLTEEQLRIRGRLSEKAILARAGTTETKKLNAELNAELKSFVEGFDGKKIKEMQGRYVMLRTLLDLICFDYFFLLKKLDSKMAEANLSYNPHFEAIVGEYVSDDLKDFLEIMPAIDAKADWDCVFDIFKEYRQVEVISRGEWKKVLGTIAKLQRSKILEMTVQLIEEDPLYKPTARSYGERIADVYLTQLRTQIDLILRKISAERRRQKLESLVAAVFNGLPALRMQNYTEAANDRFFRRAVTGYVHVSALGYLKAFLLDYCKKDVKEMVDLLLIEGKWTVDTSKVSGCLYDAFQELMQVSKKLLSFDSSLGEDGQLGSRMASLMAGGSHDRQIVGSLRQLLKDVNASAKDLIWRAARGLVELGKVLKTIREDCGKDPSELLFNWKELDSATDNSIKKRITEVYKKIYLFIQLIQMLIRKPSRKASGDAKPSASGEPL